MDFSFWWLAITTITFMVATVSVWYHIRTILWKRVFLRAKEDFRWQRERLEAKFVQIGQQRIQSTLRQWVDCEFGNDVTFVRSRLTRQLSAFVSITITLESPLPDADPNGIHPPLPPFLADPNSQVLRSATGVFVYNGKYWDTEGLTIFNLSPSETIHFYRRNLEAVN